MSRKRKPVPRRPHKPESWRISIPPVAWLSAVERLNFMEQVMRLRMSAGESLGRVVRKVAAPPKLELAKVVPSLLLGPDGKPIGART